MTAKHKYISNSDELRKTCGKEQTMTKTGADLGKSKIFCCSLLCEKISLISRERTKFNWVISRDGRSTSSSWYKNTSHHLIFLSGQLAPGDSPGIDIYDDTPHCSSQVASLARNSLSGGRRGREICHQGFGDAIPAWPLSPAPVEEEKNLQNFSSVSWETPGSYISRDPVYIVGSLSIFWGGKGGEK